MKKVEYCLLAQHDVNWKALNCWVAFLFTGEGLVEILRSAPWTEGRTHYDLPQSFIAAQRAIMMSKLGSAGWEWIEGSGVHDSFKRAMGE